MAFSVYVYLRTSRGVLLQTAGFDVENILDAREIPTGFRSQRTPAEMLCQQSVFVPVLTVVSSLCPGRRGQRRLWSEWLTPSSAPWR